MLNEFSKMEILLGEEGVDILAKAKVAVFGLGGVGSYAAEALARCGLGGLTLVDPGVISITDVNRQLYALHSTIGKAVAWVAQERIRDIEPNILVRTYETFYNQDTADMFDLDSFDYVVDAMDTVSSKLLLIEHAKKVNTPIISCMNTDNKRNPMRLEIADISKTSVCPMAKVMRAELRKMGIRKVKVLYSRERLPRNSQAIRDSQKEARNSERGSISFVPGAAGLCIASEVVKDLLHVSGH